MICSLQFQNPHFGAKPNSFLFVFQVNLILISPKWPFVALDQRKDHRCSIALLLYLFSLKIQQKVYLIVNAGPKVGSIV